MKIKIRLSKALAATAPIMAELTAVCEPYYCELAGSLRREYEFVGDVEICCVPQHWENLFGDPGESMLQLAIDRLIEAGVLSPPTKNGEKYKQFIINSTGQQLDLFITTTDRWPVIFAVRTGPADFSQQLVTKVNKGGKLPSHLKILGGRVWEGEKLYQPAPKTEREFLELCGGWIVPRERGQ